MESQRLLNVAKALRESKNPDMFDMSTYGHSCGTPACAWGHYAARTDLQDAFKLDRHGVLLNRDGSIVGQFAPDHFGVSQDELNELFEANGCGNAKTAVEAADYIEAFVKEHS